MTAPHKGTFKVYVTKADYDPSQPLAWDDLDLQNPVASATDPAASGGFYTFSGTLPQRSGKQLLYAIWQRSDSPEAFYSCSDITYGGSDSGTSDDSGDSGSGTTTGSSPTAAAPTASAPSEEQIEAGTDKSTVEHSGHGDNDASTSAEPTTAAPVAETSTPATQVEAQAAGASENLAETGGDGTTPYLAVGGAAALALGAATLFASVRRRAVSGGRHGR